MKKQQTSQAWEFVYPMAQQTEFISLQADINCLFEELLFINQQKRQNLHKEYVHDSS